MSNASTTSDDIIRCARQLIIDGGYNGFSYADIADVVGIRKASIHHHFPSKSDLVRALVAQYREEGQAGIRELERYADDPIKQLQAYVNYWKTCIADAKAPFCICALLASQIPVLPDEVVVEVRAHFRMLSSWLAAVLDRGVKQNSLCLTGSAKAEAESFLATVHGAMLSARVNNDPRIFNVITAPLLKRLIPTR